MDPVKTQRRNASAAAERQRSLAKRRQIILFSSLAVLAVGIIVAIAFASRVPEVATTPPVQSTVKVGQTAPEFEVSTTGGAFDLAQNGAKPTLLEVFATWCPHCQRETVVLNELYAKYKGRVNFVAVAGSPYDIAGPPGEGPGNPEDQADVVAFAEHFKVNYPVAFDPKLDVAGKYLQSGFPTVVVIGADRKIEAMAAGEIPLKSLSDALGAVTAGKAPNPTLGIPS